MPLLFTCPHCQIQTIVEDQYAGQAGACAECGKPITIEATVAQRLGDPAVGTSHAKTVRRIATICVAVVVLGACGVLLFRYGLAGVAKMQANSMRGSCRNNARLIAEALNAYADDYGSYPTPVVTDASGKPLYSWRVLILPYLGYEVLYDAFQLDQAWNSKANMQLSFERPSEYGSPAAGDTWQEPNYMLVTGPNTLFPASGPYSLDKIIDQPSQTLLVVEVARPINPMGASELVWTQPGDLDITQMTFTIGSKNGVEIGGNHTGGATAATCDGRDHFLAGSLSPAELRALISPNGGEPLRDDLLDTWDTQ